MQCCHLRDGAIPSARLKKTAVEPRNCSELWGSCRRHVWAEWIHAQVQPSPSAVQDTVPQPHSYTWQKLNQVLPSELREQCGFAFLPEEREGMELWKSSSSPLCNLPERFWFSSLEKYHRDWASDRVHQEGPGKDDSLIFCLSWISFIRFFSKIEKRNVSMII